MNAVWWYPPLATAVIGKLNDACVEELRAFLSIRHVTKVRETDWIYICTILNSEFLLVSDVYSRLQNSTALCFPSLLSEQRKSSF